MANLSEIVEFCNARAGVDRIKDFSGALNGLQWENDGTVSKVGAAVDAGLRPFEQAAAAGIDLLIVHHGMFWNGAKPFVGTRYARAKTLFENNIAVYSCHLPLDAHPEIGNSALLAKDIGIAPTGTFAPYEGNDIGFVGSWKRSRADLKTALETRFGSGIGSMEFGSDAPEKICVVTGSGASVVSLVQSTGADTLITGELRQNHFNEAQELGLNLYTCGHYATETYGVCALAKEVSAKFEVPYEFIETDCPL